MEKPSSLRSSITCRFRWFNLGIGRPKKGSEQEITLKTRSHKARSARPVFLYNIGQLITLRSNSPHSGPRRGAELKELGIIPNAAVLCVGGKITSVGTTEEAMRDRWIGSNRRDVIDIDCARKVALPGFVDSHTHPAFISPRLVDFEKRISGATYEQIAEAGGGIRSSIKDVRSAGKELLVSRISSAFDQMLAHGTTTVEAKSGYGLSVDAELKSLKAIRLAATRWPGSVVPTLLGAHVIPAEFKRNPGEYVRLVCEQMIPKTAKWKLARFVDVFCDRGAFSEEDTLRIFTAAQKNALRLRAHVSQLVRTPLPKLLSLGPISLDHLDQIDEADIAHLARSSTVATLVPGANYFLGLKRYPPARRLIDAGVAVALASDFNPGSSPTVNMPFILSLACTQMKMSPAESIVVATFNAACALEVQAIKGSVEPGKDADIAVFDVDDYREIPYWVATNRCELVLAHGLVIDARDSGFANLLHTWSAIQ
jgi:imidazolonepropionase